MRIFKYDISDVRTVNMPKGAKILSVQKQEDRLCMWAEVDPQQEMEPRKIKIIGTGHEFESGKYLGTFQEPPFVWHVYVD